MNNPLTNQFIHQIESLEGLEFQKFIDELFLETYGNKGYTPIRKSKDKGNDGILVANKTILACYAPKKYIKSKFEEKAYADFKDYKTHWENEYPNWTMVVNHTPNSDEIKYLNTLKKGSEIIGVEQIVHIIKQLKWSQKRDIGNYLKISDEFFSRDYIKEILDDILKIKEESREAVPYQSPSYIKDKIELNYSHKDVQQACEEYEEVVVHFPVIVEIIDLYKGYEKDAIRTRIKNDYESLPGNFKNRFNSLSKMYSNKYHNSDEHTLFVRTILIYYFEQCLIGERTKEENAKTTSRKQSRT